MKRKKKILVKISEQKLYLMINETVKKEYPISTAQAGIGNKVGSYKTPLGKHKISRRVGKGVELGTIFEGRKPTKEIAVIDPEERNVRDDLVTTRILCLEGLEKGKNKGKGIDTKHRYIWIHGTPDEKAIGTPASKGCIRMKNVDIIELFNSVRKGTSVEIIE